MQITVQITVKSEQSEPEAIQEVAVLNRDWRATLSR